VVTELFHTDLLADGQTDRYEEGTRAFTI